MMQLAEQSLSRFDRRQGTLVGKEPETGEHCSIDLETVYQRSERVTA